MRNILRKTTGLLFLLSFATNGQQAISVDIFKANASPAQPSLTLTGTIEAKQHAELAPLQSGVIDNLFVEIGDTVTKGQKLLRLDDKLAKLAVEQSKAIQTAAKAEYKEAQRLYDEVIALSKQQLVAETLLGERLSNLAIAQAKLGEINAELASKNEALLRHTLYAPFSGVIAQRNVDIGEWVTQQSKVFTLVEQDSKRLNVSIPQEYFAQLQSLKVKQQPISIKVTPDFTHAVSYNLELDTLVAVADNSSRAITGYINLPNEASLVVGMSAQAIVYLPSTFLSTNEKHLVWLPKTAVKQHPDGGTSVFIVESNKAKRVLVSIAETKGKKVAVTNVSAEYPFIVTGVELLKDGDLVSINAKAGS